MENTYTTEQASEKAIEWCKANPGWQRICDIKDTDSLYYTWEELPHSVKREWEHWHVSDPKGAWEEFGTSLCKVPFGHISGAGIFYEDILSVPRFHNAMMVFKTS